MSTKTELSKALTSSNATALNPYDLDPVLNEELLKLQPLSQLVQLIQAEAKTHEYNVRSSHPFAWFEGEATGANQQNSTYQRKNVQVKIQRIWGGVTGFVQTMDAKFIDALATELEGSIEGCANLQEFGTIWGAADDLGFTGDPYQYSGMVSRIFKFAPGNIIDAAGAKVTLDMLDQALAKATGFRGVQNDPRLWLMGVRMKQVVDGLQTRVQIPLSSMTLADGQLKMDAYGRTPIFETDYVVPDGVSAPSGLSGTSAAGGTLTPSTAYHYRIASVTRFGEQVAIADVTASTSAAQGTLNLSWTADPNAVLYYIFRGTTASNHGLIDIVPALTYDVNGLVNGTKVTYADDGSKTANALVKPLNAGEQNIVLANLNPRRGLAYVGKIDDMGRPVDNLWSFVELARVKDSFDYMLKAYMTERIVYPNLFSMIRGVKTA